jgi:hypothetical protein
MSWRVSVGFAVAASAGASCLLSLPVRADDAYLCGPDRVVYVAAADLEMKKHSDPCIAQYYGIKIDEAPKTAAVTPVAAAAAKIATLDSAELRLLGDAEVPDRAARRPERQASLEPPRAMAGTDFRNVRILNAASPDGAWFHHSR